MHSNSTPTSQLQNLSHCYQIHTKILVLHQHVLSFHSIIDSMRKIKERGQTTTIIQALCVTDHMEPVRRDWTDHHHQNKDLLVLTDDEESVCAIFFFFNTRISPEGTMATL